jgi:hypothetical protein
MTLTRETATAEGGGATREWPEQQFARSKGSLVLKKEKSEGSRSGDLQGLRLFESALGLKTGQLSVLEFE